MKPNMKVSLVAGNEAVHFRSTAKVPLSKTLNPHLFTHSHVLSLTLASLHLYMSTGSLLCICLLLQPVAVTSIFNY